MWPTLIYIIFSSHLGDSQICSWKTPGFSRAPPSSCPERGCFAAPHGLFALPGCPPRHKIIYQNQNNKGLTFPSTRECFHLVLHTGEEQGEGCPAVFYFPSQGRLGRGLFICSPPSPNLQSWEQEPSGSVISVSGPWLALGWAGPGFGECICLTEGSQKAQLWCGWREKFVLGIPASLRGLWMDPRVKLQHVRQD